MERYSSFSTINILCTNLINLILIYNFYSSTVTIEDSPNKINVMDALTILQQTDEPGPPQDIDPIGNYRCITHIMWSFASFRLTQI